MLDAKRERVPTRRVTAAKGFQWPADKVTRRPLAQLVPAARNARTHSAAQVTQLAASIKEWSWTVPVLCDEHGGIIAGHGRVLAAKKLGLDTADFDHLGWYGYRSVTASPPPT